MTNFIEYHFSQFSTLHIASFENNGEEYEVTLQKVATENIPDSSLIFPVNYRFSSAGCWEVSFDLARNRKNKTWFQPPPPRKVSALSVLRRVETILIDHYVQYKGGMYVFYSENEHLSLVYKRLINRRLGKGTTLESGLDPQRRGYVIRTQKCYCYDRGRR